jgi:hypothetical protein
MNWKAIREWNPPLPGEFKLVLVPYQLERLWDDLWCSEYKLFGPEKAEEIKKSRISVWIDENHPGFHLNEYSLIDDLAAKELHIESGLWVQIIINSDNGKG